ncbi:MAG: carbamoyltransferase HypF [Eggerthellaceae bacterium]|nr:carbamoyltransferase HypF [Eggerthellaceae bacterium]
MTSALEIIVKGIVQGVGFRPFVYRCAKKHLVSGWVYNDIEGVFIHAEAQEDLLNAFVDEISNNAPSAAKISEISLNEVPLQHPEGFEIRFSGEKETDKTTFVSPDLAICDDCLRELFEKDNPRYLYPFINCTNCGPRYTIIRDLPYDRKNTSMSAFEMCDFCRSEYDDPQNRRFHAQPNACDACGPHLMVFEKDDSSLQKCIYKEELFGNDAACISHAVSHLMAGEVIAIKGLGGFHLACDATNEKAIAHLRAHKHRDNKAFAVMVSSVEDIEPYCFVSKEERALLCSTERPIVLLKKKPDVDFASGLADKLPELGVMLAYTPLQHLVFHELKSKGSDIPFLVMTSANIHDEPIVIDDWDALERFGFWVSCILGNNRAILNRFDDSVVRVLSWGEDEQDSAVQMIRRARGYAPRPLLLPSSVCHENQKVLFAAGPEQKNTFCIARGNEAFVSQHIGDLENASAFDAWLEAKSHIGHLFNLKPDVVALDMHPEYLSSKWAKEQTDMRKRIEIQHHHAHIVSVMAEHNLNEPVCGIAFDGTGYGTDEKIWGGEVLLALPRDFERFANFAYIPMPGGAACIKNPMRMAYGALWAYELLDHPFAKSFLKRMGETAAICEQMTEKGINCPMTSSVGRLFDAASALLGICTNPTYEGEGAVLLEAAVSEGFDEIEDEARYAVAITKNTATKDSTAQDTGVLLLDAQPTFKAMLDDMQNGVDVGVIARRFHDAIIGCVIDMASIVRELYGISIVALGGGVFMNRYLVEHLSDKLRTAGFTVALNKDLPPNDGCISYGQAVVALAKTKQA